MSKVATSVIKRFVHKVTNIREYQYSHVKKFAKNKINKNILEVGSGPLVKGKYNYSTKHLFDEKNNFIQSDIIKSYGHPIVDLTKMKYKNEFDIILCLNVLEHVYDFHLAVKNMHKALKKGGVAVIAVPMFYPLHDEPWDYWRFSEHALRKIFSDFKIIKFAQNGRREYPFTYYLEAKKPKDLHND